MYDSLKFIETPQLIPSGGFYTNTGSFKKVFIMVRGEWVPAPLFGQVVKGYAPGREYLYATSPHLPHAIVEYEQVHGEVCEPEISYVFPKNSYPRPLPPDLVVTPAGGRGVPDLPADYPKLKWFCRLPYYLNDNVPCGASSSWVQYYPKQIYKFPPIYLNERGLTIKNFLSVKEAVRTAEQFNSKFDFEKNWKRKPKSFMTLNIAHHTIKFSIPMVVWNAIPNIIKLKTVSYAYQITLVESNQSIIVLPNTEVYITHYRPRGTID